MKKAILSIEIPTLGKFSSVEFDVENHQITLSDGSTETHISIHEYPELAQKVIEIFEELEKMELLNGK